MRIRFLGAIGTVTGSCTLIEYYCCEKNEKQYFLVDAGSFVNETNQSQDEERKKILKYIAKDIKMIFITHAHLDHIGILPEIIKFGFRGKICSTQATHKLIIAMLTYGEVNKNNIDLLKKIDFIDIDGKFGDKQNIGFGKTYIPITSNFRYGFLRSSHVLGSCSIYFQWTEKNYSEDCSEEEKDWKYLYFSGDIGPVSDNIMSNILFKEHQTPYWDKYEKCIIMESTYGNKLREKENLIQKKMDILSDVINTAISNDEIIIIPSFALDRAQQILIDLFLYFKNNEKRDLLPKIVEDKWNYILEHIFNETMIKNIISSNKIKSLQGKDKKQLRKNLTKEIEKVSNKCSIDTNTVFKNTDETFKKLLADIFEQNKILLPIFNDDSILFNKFSFHSPLIEIINEIYIQHLTDEAYSNKDKQRKFKYISDKFLEELNITKESIQDKRSEIKKILSLFMTRGKEQNKSRIIVTASGMCEEGSVLNLLEKFLIDEKAVIILTGFQYAKAYTNFGIVYYNIAEYDNAIERLNQAITLLSKVYSFNQDNINTFLNSLYYRGISYKETRKYYLAKKDFEKILDINPNDYEVKRMLLDVSKWI